MPVTHRYHVLCWHQFLLGYFACLGLSLGHLLVYSRSRAFVRHSVLYVNEHVCHVNAHHVRLLIKIIFCVENPFTHFHASPAMYIGIHDRSQSIVDLRSLVHPPPPPEPSFAVTCSHCRHIVTVCSRLWRCFVSVLDMSRTTGNLFMITSSSILARLPSLDSIGICGALGGEYFAVLCSVCLVGLTHIYWCSGRPLPLHSFICISPSSVLFKLFHGTCHAFFIYFNWWI